ncbi:hypothetical protein D7T48_20240 [Stenotrophomonas maltophilia]|nr:hypothetical protein C6Y55_13355 [Stenotrophomonas maltophilia]MBA0279024.1 hypothetical protein [Stenotrophomonas maltophilia]MBA0414505.1 hypothetical protein [Stenotrophomonas maltophilia]MBA0504392.1 hypothetical protein [Stenotrophomonas maltophilia]MBA0508667.1 hypothetical protein [Stenotrophomonas maltophilia]
MSIQQQRAIPGQSGRGHGGIVDPRHAWRNLHRNRVIRRLIEEHPRMAWIYCRLRRIVEGGVGPVAGA